MVSESSSIRYSVCGARVAVKVNANSTGWPPTDFIAVRRCNFLCHNTTPALL